MAIKLMKLISGEELIGDVEILPDEEYDDITVKNACILKATIVNNTLQLGILPYLLGNPEIAVKIKADYIITGPLNPSEETEAVFIKKMSNISVPTKNIVTSSMSKY